MSVDHVEVLKARAASLAKKPDEALERLPLTVFIRGGQQYGLALHEVESAGRLKQLSLVPGAPPWMHGAIQHRGRVISLVDVAKLWNQSLAGVSDLPTYVVISSGGARMGVLVESLLGVHEMDGAPVVYQGAERVGVTHVARKGGIPVLLLSAARLLEDPRLKG
jgi:purine-binding chemotaxis protein CheW